MKLGCVIVDDEHLARQYLMDYVSKVPFLELLGDFNSPLKALELLKSNRVDIMFLDIEMPDISGLDFLKTLDHLPFVILTTAYKQYALDGYELNVADYLLKPFSFDRFLMAVNKVAEQVRRSASAGAVEPEDDELPSPVLHSDYLVIRADRKYYKINYADLVMIEGQKAYVTFHTTDKKITALASLKTLEETLPGQYFVRIHKSYIVSINHIQSLESGWISINNRELPVGKNYRENVDRIFGF